MPQDIIRIRRDSYASWYAQDPTLALGEISYDLTNKQIKVGDGTTLWRSLQAIGSSTLANGDYGDILVSAGGTVMTLDSALMTIINNKITQGPLDGGSPGTAGQVLNIRRGNTGSWSGVVLSAGEIGYDTTTSELKVGDGVTAWGSLPTIGATASVNNLNALTDVTITGTPASQQALLYNSGTSQWTNQAIPTPVFPLDTLSDVTITSPSNTQLLQYNGTAWVNVTPAVTEPSIGAGSKNHINVVSLNSDWRINNNVITQDMLELTSPINPSDAATKSYTDTTVGMAITAAVLEDLDQTGGIATTAYVREDSGPSIGTYIDDHLDVPNYIAKLDSDKRISASSLPVNGISMRNLKYSDRDKENTGRNIIRTLHTDGTSVGDFVWSTYTAVNPLATGTIVHTDEYSYMQTEENQYGSIGRLRQCHVGFGGINTDLDVDDCPKVFKAIVKYDGSANDSTVATVGFHATHGQLSDLLACFDCFGTTNWWMRVTMGYSATPTDRGVVGGNYENMVYYVDSGIPVSEFRHLAIKVVKGNQPKDTFPSPGADGIYFYELTPNNLIGYPGGPIDYTWTQKGFFALPDLIINLYPNALPRCYVGLEIRQKNIGTNKSSQKLYFKDITYHEYTGYSQFAPIAHTHTLANLTQSAATDGQVPTWNNTALAWQPATPSGAGGGGVTNGDKGDINVTGSGDIWTIDPGAVTYAKMQNVTGNRILGRLQGTGAGVVTEMLCTPLGQNLIACADSTAMQGVLSLGTLATATLQSGNGSIAVTSPTFGIVDIAVPNSAITYARMQNVSASDKLLGRSTAGAGVVEEIPCTAVGRAIIAAASAGDQRTHLGLLGLARLDTVTDTEIANNTISGLKITDTTLTYAKMQNVATDKLLGRSTSGAGVVEEIACTAAGRALLANIDASAQRSTLGLGALATLANAPAGTLTGTTLAAGVTASSLTSVGTLATLTVTAAIAGSVTGNAATVTTNANLTGHITSSGSNVTSLGTFTSLELKTALSDETGSGAAVFANTPTLVTPILGTPSSGNLSNCTNLPSHTHAASDITSGVIATARLGTGSPDNTNFLRGDGTWQSVSGSGTTFQQSLRIAALL